MNFNKILLVNPNQMKPVVTPVALDYLHASLEQAGFQVIVLDLAFSENAESDIESVLQDRDFLLIGVTIRNIDDCYFASQDFCLEKYKKIIDLLKKHTNAPLVLGGVGFSIMPQPVMDYLGVELAIRGEGEAALTHLALAMKNNRDYSGISNLIYKESGSFKSNPVTFLPLETLQLASRQGIDHRRYLIEGGQVGFETKRGCNQACIYCADPLSKGRRIRMRPPDQIAEELDGLYHKGVDHFHTCDSEFNLPYEHALAVCQAIIKKGLGERIRWYAYASPEPFDRALAVAMKKAGCAGIDFGVDHASDRILKNLGRTFGLVELERTAKVCHDEGFAFMYDLLLGGPGETKESIRETIEAMKRLNPSRVGVSLGIRLYPGSPLAQRVLGTGTGQSLEATLKLSSKNLWGMIENNGGLLKPIFYVSPELDHEVEDYLQRLIDGDVRFFLGKREQTGRSYNYNDNSQLIRAIKRGYRGAFWDILLRLGSVPE